MRTRALSALLLLAGSLAACHDSTGTPQPAAITAANPIPAQAVAGSTVPLSAKVTDDAGKGLAGVAVQWAVTGPGGGTVSPASSLTNGDGVAVATWTLGTTAGGQTATATIGAHIVTFSTEAVAGAAASVAITPDSVGFSSIGDTATLHVVAADANHNATAVSWISLDPGVAQVSSAGLVTAVGNGRARIVATSGTKADTAIAGVRQVAVSIRLTAVNVAPGATVQVPLEAFDARGHPIEGLAFTWATVLPGVATVNASGFATGVRAGITQVTAALNGLVATGYVNVTGTTPLLRPSAGRTSTCAVTAGDQVFCVGTPVQDPLAYVPTSVAPIIAPVPLNRVWTGSGHRCALTPDGHAYCWGFGPLGQVGNGVVGPTFVKVPESVAAGGLTFTQLAAGFDHTCGITAAGAAWCWGSAAHAQLGTATGTVCTPGAQCSAVPVAVAGGLAFTQIDAYGNHTCALATTGDVYCWGEGFSATPAVVLTGRTYTQVTVGGAHVCALSGGVAYCTGDNTYGQLGVGDTAPHAGAVAVSGGHSFTQIDAGESFTCGLEGGLAWCWGRNDHQQLGSLVAGPVSAVPTAGSGSYTRISAGQAHACGEASDGVYCWGWDAFGQVGRGTGDSPVPYRMFVNIH